jgi:DNA polymerase-3 subunit gamma/tau
LEKHLVLARKWRPENFGELVGQEHVTRTLAQALKSGRISHAFLFTGIRGVGKTTAARILARCLNCERGPTPEPCGECPACVEIRAGRALDVVEIDGATYRKIDDARAIIENLSYRPARDRFKIYIIDEAHQLTDQAFNALLKTLEEPPAHVKFILATTEPQKMPETILSRLQRYDFRRLPLATILGRLEELARREQVEVETSALVLLAREAGGSMRDAERMFETAIALSTGTITEGAVAETLGVASRSRVYGLAEAILQKRAAAALSIVRELYGCGANLEALGRDLLETLRNLAVARLPQEGQETPFSDLPDQEAAEVKRLANAASLRDLMRLFRLMAQAQEEILRSPYPDLLLEMAVVRMATIAPVIEADELLRAISAAEKTLGLPPAAAAVAPERGTSGQSQAGGVRRLKVEGEVKADAPRKAAVEIDSGDEGRELPELRNFIRNKRAALAGFMDQGAALGLDGDVLKIRPRNSIYTRYLSDNRSVIAQCASELYGRRITAEVVADGAPGPFRSAETAPLPARSSAVGTSDPAGITREPESAAGREASPSERAKTAALDNPVESAGATNPSDGGRADREAVRQALYADPVVRQIRDQLEARLVDVRSKPAPRPAQASAGEPQPEDPEE